MRTIYLDSDYICHAEYAEGRAAVETAALDHVCNAALTCFVYVPEGQLYVKPNGVTIKGEFIQCFDSRVASLLQALYEEEQAKATAEIAALVEEVYNSDMEVIENV